MSSSGSVVLLEEVVYQYAPVGSLFFSLALSLCVCVPSIGFIVFFWSSLGAFTTSSPSSHSPQDDAGPRSPLVAE